MDFRKALAVVAGVISVEIAANGTASVGDLFDKQCRQLAPTAVVGHSRIECYGTTIEKSCSWLIAFTPRERH